MTQHDLEPEVAVVKKPFDRFGAARKLKKWPLSQVGCILGTAKSKLCSWMFGNNPYPTEMTGPCLDFYKLESRQRYNLQFRRHLYYQIVGGNALDRHRDPAYIVLAYKTPADEIPFLRTMQKAINDPNNRFLTQAMNKAIELAEANHPLAVRYYAMLVMCPDGWYMNQRLPTARGMVAHIVYTRGHARFPMCSHCSQKFITHVDGSSTHVLAPHAACVTLAGVGGDKCSNCYGDDVPCEQPRMRQESEVDFTPLTDQDAVLNPKQCPNHLFFSFPKISFKKAQIALCEPQLQYNMDYPPGRGSIAVALWEQEWGFHTERGEQAHWY